MDAIEAMLGRRSIRKYEGLPLDEEQIETLLRAAMAAPSAGNQQSWRFIVVRDPARLEALSHTSPYATMLPHAALAIVVCGETDGERHVGYWVQDCSAAMQNLLVAAHALGLGAVWLGFHPADERERAAADLLGTPGSVRVLGIASIGHPAETKEPADRYDEAKVFRERWGGDIG